MPASPRPVRDLDDPAVAAFRDLRDRSRDEDGLIVEGAIAVARLIESRRPVLSVLATPTHAERLAPSLDADTHLLVAPASLLREVVGFDFHRGCLALAARPSARESDDGTDAALDQWIADLRPRARLTVVAAIGLADPVNLGAIVRTARAFGVDLVLWDRAGADPFSRRAIRASMGNVFCVPLLELAEPTRALARLRDGLSARVVAASPRPAARTLSTVAWPRRAIVLFGNEGRGLADDVLAQADLEITIPIEPAADSLNVGSAAAILLHHAYTVQNPA